MNKNVLRSETGAVLIALVALASTARAQTEIKVPAAANQPIENVRLVVAPAARCAAVSDSARRLAIGRAATNSAEAQVSLYPLDEKGEPTSAAPAVLKLPRPKALDRFKNQPLSLAFHPKLPLLYVWQDIQAPPKASPAALAEFDHLLIYSLEEDKPELLAGLGRGEEFAHNQGAGSIIVDREGTRLYLPNLSNPGAKGPAAPAVGWVALQADGLPQPGDGTKGEEVQVSGPGELKRRDKKATADKAAKLAGKPLVSKRVASQDATAFPSFPTGLGFVPVSSDVVIVGGSFGPVTWDANNRRARFNSLMLPPFKAGKKEIHHMIAGHPSLPVVYVSDINSDSAYSLEHADGYLTMLPRKATLVSAELASAPVVMGQTGKVALGGVNQVYVVSLDAQGHFKPERLQMSVPNPSVQALAYSEKFDRLYVAVEKKK